MYNDRTRQVDRRGCDEPLRAIRQCRGFTLVEALLASTILAIVASAALLPFAAGMQQVNAAAELEQATALGEALMEEVLARPFFEPDQVAPTPGPDASETNRLEYKSVDDFSGFSESSGDLRNFEDNTITDPAVAGFWRTVSIQYVTFPNQDPSDVNSFMHVQVKVYRETALLVTLDRIVTRED
jgi:prepilin-type N-terminal cleavage/methylation domain-containing protein